MLPGLAPASSAMSRIETALKPRVENNSSAALRMASRMFGFRVMRFAFRSRLLYVCTKYQVQSTNIGGELTPWLDRQQESCRMRRIIVAFLIVAGALAWRGVSPAVASDPETRLILAPSGVLRAGLYPGTPTSILPDAGSGEPRGVGYELGKELARRLGVPYEPVVFAKNAEVLAAVKSGEVDVAFTNATAARTKEMDFGPPYLEIELGYLVARGSALTNAAEMDA